MRKRKVNGILTALIAALLLSACGGQPSVVPGTDPVTAEATTERQGSAEAPETVETADLEPVTEPASPEETAAPTEETTAGPETTAVPPETAAPTSETPSEPDAETTPAETEPETAGDFFRTRVPDYSRPERWAWLGEGEDRQADLFFVGPTVLEDGLYLRLTDQENLEYFRTSLAQERGLYDSVCTLYAPYYRQMSVKVYTLPREEQSFWRDQAYRDVSAAFRYFLEHLYTGKPLILAGFSQGAELTLRLMQEYLDPDTAWGAVLQDRLVAVYAIGAGLPQTMVEEYPWMKPADSAWDTGVIITYDCEQPGITGSVLLPAGSRSLSINPLTWSRGTEPADKSLNKGACFLSGGQIWLEIPQLCGCYIEPDRGALVVTGINYADFPTDADILPPGNLHEYDYQFFYRNLQENVRTRLNQYLNGR